MKKCIVAFVCAAMLAPSAATAVFADTFVNTTFTGYYRSAGATDTFGASMNISFIDNNTFTIQFSYKKDGRESFVYTFDQGSFNDTKGSVRFSAVRHDGAYTPTGTMTLELREDRILVSCDTDDGVHLFNGDMIRQSAPVPATQPTQAPQINPTPQQPAASSQRATARVVINGTEYSFNAGQEPFIDNGHTYVPLRSVFDKMGMNVYWADYQYTDQLREQSITCVKNDTIIKFSRSYNDIGSNTWALTKWVNSETSDTAAGTMINTTGMQPIIENGTSYVPLRVISEAFGITPQWDDANKTVIIDCDTTSYNKLPAETISHIENFSSEIAAQYITDDFSDIVLNSYPYYDTTSKYYLFDAKDQYGEIYLKIAYGGYVTAIPKKSNSNASLTDAEISFGPAVDETSDNVSADIPEETDDVPPTDAVEQEADINNSDETTAETESEETAAQNDSGEVSENAADEANTASTDVETDNDNEK